MFAWAATSAKPETSASPLARGGAAPDTVTEALGSPGRPLDTATRAFFEPRFGHDFSRVRVHAGAAGQRSARELNARAYTVGHDIVLGRGEPGPAAPEGRRLLAHELTHVVQQRGRPVAPPARLAVSPPADTAERHADVVADAVMHGGAIPPLDQVPPLVQRKCQPAELGAPNPDCAPSSESTVGWQLLFQVGCDDLLPGEETKIEKLTAGNQLRIHGFASSEGDAAFNLDLSCHRANIVADLVRAKRADCPVLGTFKHGASPPTGPGTVKDPNPPDFWRSVIIEQVKPPLQSPEQWLDPDSKIGQGWASLNRAKADPSTTNLDAVAKGRADLKVWLEGIGKSLAPAGAKLTQRNLDDYRRFYASAERLWQDSDQLLALHSHAEATKDTYDAWAKGTGLRDQGPDLHAKGVPAAKYHIDIFGEGFFKGAVNLGMAERTTTTGVSGTRVPNLIYRKFSGKTPNQIPIADRTADLVTEENGPIGFPGLAAEIARILAPGGTVILYNPEESEADHDAVAKAVGGTVTKVRTSGTLQTTIVAPVAP